MPTKIKAHERAMMTIASLSLKSCNSDSQTQDTLAMSGGSGVILLRSWGSTPDEMLSSQLSQDNLGRTWIAWMIMGPMPRLERQIFWSKAWRRVGFDSQDASESFLWPTAIKAFESTFVSRYESDQVYLVVFVLFLCLFLFLFITIMILSTPPRPNSSL